MSELELVDVTEDIEGMCTTNSVNINTTVNIGKFFKTLLTSK